MPNPEWRADEYGKERRALYLGGLYVGEIRQWHRVDTAHHGQWRGWFMSDDSGKETGWFTTADEARASVEAALAAAIS